MKKNISINIGGIIFHVEEDGYEALKNYLETINRYFSDFQDSQEIINDIENRIAEIFLSKLKEEKQVITYEDIQSLMATLGSIEDFKKAEAPAEEAKESSRQEEYTSTESEAGRKLYRDTQRKIFGGVAAGLAHYFNIDALFIRLAFIVLFVSPFFLDGGGFSTVVAIAYIVCWIFLPSSPFLKEDESVKKFYRSEENKVIGGVAKGLSAYMGVDVAIVRIIFVLLLIPGGAGFFIYLVLWLITPSAKTVTQKMQMEGTPITLSNIEKNIKSGFNVKEGEENLLVRILLFPFRLVAVILNGIAKALGPVLKFVVDAVRVILGIALLIAGLAMSISVVALTLASTGYLAETDYVQLGGLPYELVANTISTELTIALIILLLVPAIFIAIAGISVMAKSWVLNKTVGFSLLGIWVLGIILSAIFIPATALQFNKKATITEVETFQIEDKTAVLKVNEKGSEDFKYTRVTLRGYEGEEFRLERNFEARGNTRLKAEENAKMITHEVSLENDSVLWIDSNFQFAEDAVFRGQNLQMTLYIPYGQPFKMDRKMRHILRNTIYVNGYTVRQIAGNTWMFNVEGLQCLTCDEQKSVVSSASKDSFYEVPFYISDDIQPIVYDFTNFDEVSVSSGIFVEIRQGDTYQVALFSEEEDLEDLEISNRNGRLRIDYDFDNWNWGFGKSVPDMKFIITLPELQKLNLSAGAVAHVVDFQSNTFKAHISSAARLYMRGAFNEIDVNVSSAAKVNLGGSADYVDADISSAAKMNAYELIAKKVKVNVSSAAKASVNATETLNANASSAGKISYKGNPEANSNSSSGGQVSRDN